MVQEQICSLVGLWLLFVEKASIPKARAGVVYRQSYKRFVIEHFVEDVRNIDWCSVYSADDPEASLAAFINIFMEIVSRHGPMKKFTAKTKIDKWIDSPLKN